MKHSSHPVQPVITQDKKNTTLWIGHLATDPMEHYAGQIFTCPSSGLIDNIQLYAAAVQNPGEVDLTLHEFDPATKGWGNMLASTSLSIDKNDHTKWIRFSLPALQLNQGHTYGFRVHSKNGMVGLGEAATANNSPFKGQEWNADSLNQRGYYYSYFNLAFKVELCA